MNTIDDWLREGPFTLSLSAGFFGFFAHAGALSALLDAGHKPARVAGSSAGALVAGLWAGGAEPHEIEVELLGLRREHFWDPALGFGLLRGELFRSRIRRLMRTPSFETARVPAALSAWDIRTRRTRVLERGDLASAICASCAFPGLLQPVEVDGRNYLDGGIADRPGHLGLGVSERVLFHHLPSKSPWRSHAPPVPSRASMVTIAIDGLPRLNPFQLERGGEAFSAAKQEFAEALAMPFRPVVRRAA